MVYQGLKGFFPALDLIDGNEAAQLVYMHDRLDLQYRGNGRGSAADPAAPFKIHQIIHGKPVDKMQLVLLQPGYHGVKVQLLFQPGRIVHIQALAHAGAEAIHHGDLPVGIFFQQFGFGDARGSYGAG